MTAALNWKNGRETYLWRKLRRKGDEGGGDCRPHREEMKQKSYKFLILCMSAFLLTGCNISFSDGLNLTGSGEKAEETAIPSGAVKAETGNEIKIQDVALRLPEGMKYGEKETDAGRAFYVWETDKPYVLPTDSDIIMYVYEGKDTASPDNSLTDSEARYSIAQTYMQVFRENVDGKISADPITVSNDDWYILQLTGYSGDYLTTSYGTMCYPKYYYGVYALEKTNDNYSRNYSGFVFSNDSTGKIISEKDYNDIYGQIKTAFSITKFYSAPMLEYDEAKDFSNGYSYKQFSALFADAINYYGMVEQQSDTGNEVRESQKADNNESSKLSEPCQVERVVDGDTIIVTLDGEETRIRLIGIDTPESVSDDKAKNTEEGKEASAFTTEQLSGKMVYLEYDKEQTDTYGRTLAYVYHDDGETMYNKVLLERGYAVTMTIEPNTKYAADFKALENTARESGKGFWGTGFFTGD